jgi:hypothetical protein
MEFAAYNVAARKSFLRSTFIASPRAVNRLSSYSLLGEFISIQTHAGRRRMKHNATHVTRLG